MKTAIITGINGQDGSYLSELLLKKKYNIIGIVRNENSNLSNLEYLGIKDRLIIIDCDLLSFESLKTIFLKYKPEEVYNLAAQSSVGRSFIEPKDTFLINTMKLFQIIYWQEYL